MSASLERRQPWTIIPDSPTELEHVMQEIQALHGASLLAFVQATDRAAFRARLVAVRGHPGAGRWNGLRPV